MCFNFLYSKIGNTDISPVESTVTGAIGNLIPQSTYADSNNSSITVRSASGSAAGSVDTLNLGLMMINSSVFIYRLDIRIKDVPESVSPIVEVFNSNFTAFPYFLLTVPAGSRGRSSTQYVSTDGGYLYHNRASGTVMYVPYEYAAPRPEGYLHITA